MTFQDDGTPWGSGVADRPRAERELCADRESKQRQPERGRVNSTERGQTSNDAGPLGAGAYPTRSGGLPPNGSDAREGARPLKVVYWNVAAINAGDIDTFLAQLDIDIQWDVLVLLEFSAAYKEMHLSCVRRAGHLVSAQPFEYGRRAGCLVLHQRLEIREISLLNCDRA